MLLGVGGKLGLHACAQARLGSPRPRPPSGSARRLPQGDPARARGVPITPGHPPAPPARPLSLPRNWLLRATWARGNVGGGGRADLPPHPGDGARTSPGKQRRGHLRPWKALGGAAAPATGAAHWLARPMGASPRVPAPSPTVNYQPPWCGRRGAGWRPRESGGPDRFCMTIDAREGARRGGRTAPGSASHHGDEAFPP